MNPVLVKRFRGTDLESFHRGAVCVVESSGKVIFSLGDINQRAHARSALKIYQQIPLIQGGAAEKFALTGEEIAVTCGSHNGEKRHVEAVRSILKKCRLSEEHLQCGSQYPSLTEDRRIFYKNDEKPGNIYNNCSGKHAGFLMGCVHRKLDVDKYLDPNHPLQTEIRKVVGEMHEVPENELVAALDGCSAPIYSMAIKNQAIAAKNFSMSENFSPERERALKILQTAITENPFMVAGTRRYCTQLMESYPGQIVAKTGAEGVFVISFIRKKLGCAIKIDDGLSGPQYRVAQAIIEKVLGEKCGPDRDLKRYLSEPMKNRNGFECGYESVDFGLFEDLRV